MKNKVVIFSLMLMISAFGAWAQNLPADLWSSPQSKTTEGRYRSNADDFIRPDSYTGVKINKWFGMLSFLNDANNTAVSTIGFATYVKKFYIGAFYSGNLWANAPVNNPITEEPATVPNGGVAGGYYDVYDSISVSGITNPVNNISILVGYFDMGLRITFRTNYQSFDESNIVTGDQLYSDYYDNSGYNAVQVAWAYSKDLIKNGIRPYAAVDLVFNNDFQEATTVGADADGVTGSKVGRSLNHFDPSFSAGLGGYTFYNEDGFKASADFDYVLTFNLYNGNEYSYVEDGVYKTGKITGTYSPGSNPYVQYYFVSNLLTPSVSASWSDDVMSFKVKLNLPLYFSSREEDSMGLDSSGSLIYNGASNMTSTFTFRPDLRLAFQYKIIPNRLILNAGARIQATAITRETINQEYYTDNIRNAGRKISNNSFGGSYVNRFSIGPTFYLREYAWIEATTGVTNVYGNEGVIDVFAPGNLFSFGSILVAVKF